MLNWTLENLKGLKHHIVADSSSGTDNIALTIVRIKPNGGVPCRISVQLPNDSTYSSVVKKVENLANLDDDIFSTLSQPPLAE